MRYEGQAAEPAFARTDLTDSDWSRLYADEGPGVLRYLRRLARDDQAAEDLMQEVFVRAMSARSVPASGPERTYWLYRVATNIAIDHLRRARRFQWLPLRNDVASSTESVTGEADQVRQALRSIPPDQAVSLVLRTNGYSRLEIARMLQLSDAAVKSRLFRARENFAASYRRLERGLTR